MGYKNKQNNIKIFPKSKIYGCFFHYVKALWKKAKKYGLCNKEKLKDTIILIFSFKVFQYLEKKDKNNFLIEIKNIYSNKNDYQKMIKYFESNWAHNKFLNFEIIYRSIN